MCYARRKIEGGVGGLMVQTFLKPNGRSRNLNVYGEYIQGQFLDNYLFCQGL